LPGTTLEPEELQLESEAMLRRSKPSTGC
jgi:hypothetical protein